MTKRSSVLVAAGCAAIACAIATQGAAAAGDDGSRLLTLDHYVRLTSKVPAIAGQQSTVYVREKVRASLEKRILEKGFVVLFWGDAGWIRFFSKDPARLPSDFKRMKMFTWAGDAYQADLMKAAGYQPVPLEINDILPGLQNGMITAVAQPPFWALAGQMYKSPPVARNADPIYPWLTAARQTSPIAPSRSTTSSLVSVFSGNTPRRVAMMARVLSTMGE